MSNSTNVYFNTFDFSVSADGAYSAELAATAGPNRDTYLFVYQGFNPASPLTGLLNADDDYSGAFSILGGSTNDYFSLDVSSRIAPGEGSNFASGGLSLSAGVTYTAVVTSFANGLTFDYRLGLGDGPGAVTLGAVPEPASMAVLGLGLAALM